MGLKMKNVNIIGVHQFLGERGQKKNKISEELPKKGGFDNFQSAWQKNRVQGVFETGWYLDPDYDLILIHTGT